jgi:hypothetical protein
MAATRAVSDPQADKEVKMHLLLSALLVGAGAVLVAAADESVRGIEANTIGGVVILLGLLYALVALVVSGTRAHFAARAVEDDEPAVFPRR